VEQFSPITLPQRWVRSRSSQAGRLCGEGTRTKTHEATVAVSSHVWPTTGKAWGTSSCLYLRWGHQPTLLIGLSLIGLSGHLGFDSRFRNEFPGL